MMKEDRLQDIADRLEVRRKPKESYDEFRARVAVAFWKANSSGVGTVEILTGKAREAFGKEEIGLSLSLYAAGLELAEQRMHSQGDTYRNISWEKYETLLRLNGFTKAHSYRFESNYQRPPVVEEYAIWADTNSGLLLTAESWKQTQLSGSKLHCELTIPYELNDIQNITLDALLDGTKRSPRKEDGCYVLLVEKDATEGLIGFARKLRSSSFTPNNPWRHLESRHLWLLDSVEERTQAENYVAIAKSKLATLPADVRGMLGMANIL